MVFVFFKYIKKPTVFPILLDHHGHCALAPATHAEILAQR
jgi:hypothetical protein